MCWVIAAAQLVVCDALRTAQIFSTLISNALIHGAKDGPARPDDGLGLGLFIASEPARAHGGTLVQALQLCRYWIPAFAGMTMLIDVSASTKNALGATATARGRPAFSATARGENPSLQPPPPAHWQAKLASRIIAAPITPRGKSP